MPKAREYFERKQVFKSYKLIKDDENGILLDVEFAFDDELLNIIKAWIPYMKIIEPKELDTKLKDILKNYINDIKVHKKKNENPRIKVNLDINNSIPLSFLF